MAETIIDANDAAIDAGVATGFQFEPANIDDLRAALERAIAAFNNRELLKRLQAQAMRANFSWEKSAAQYLALFEGLVSKEPQDSLSFPDILPDAFARMRIERRQARQ